MITGIAAVARNGMLGLAGWLPWDVPEELAYFERTVAGGALVVGRLTYESMDVVPQDTFVVTGQRDYPVRPGCFSVPDVEAGIRAAAASGKPVFVIGGASVYEAAWPYLDQFFLTRIEADFVGDTLFPQSIPLANWILASEQVEEYLELKTQKRVACRFMRYLQPNPRVLGPLT